MILKNVLIIILSNICTVYSIPISLNKTYVDADLADSYGLLLSKSIEYCEKPKKMSSPNNYAVFDETYFYDYDYESWMLDQDPNYQSVNAPGGSMYDNLILIDFFHGVNNTYSVELGSFLVDQEFQLTLNLHYIYYKTITYKMTSETGNFNIVIVDGDGSGEQIISNCTTLFDISYQPEVNWWESVRNITCKENSYLRPYSIYYKIGFEFHVTSTDYYKCVKDSNGNPSDNTLAQDTTFMKAYKIRTSVLLYSALAQPVTASSDLPFSNVPYTMCKNFNMGICVCFSMYEAPTTKLESCSTKSENVILKNCIVADSEREKCVLCKPNYMLDVDVGKCDYFKCSAFDVQSNGGCAYCLSTGGCMICNTGFYPSPQTSTCITAKHDNSRYIENCAYTFTSMGMERAKKGGYSTCESDSCDAQCYMCIVGYTVSVDGLSCIIDESVDGLNCRQ